MSGTAVSGTAVRGTALSGTAGNGAAGSGAAAGEPATLRAPVGLMAGRRRRLGPGGVRVTLTDLLILTWRLPPAALRHHLPAGLEPVVDSGDALLGALLFRNRALRPALLGLPRLSCSQLNVRSYVLDPATGEAGSVYFHGFHPRPRWLAWWTRTLFRTPATPLPFRVRRHPAATGAPRPWRATSRDGSVEVVARPAAAPLALPPHLADLLTNVHTGYASAPSGGLLAWTIWHPPQDLHPMTVDRLHLRPLAPFGLADRPPDLAFLVETVDYEVHLPARRVRLD